MKKTLFLAMTIAMGITASAYAANPFSDVPAGHWAYDAVNNSYQKAWQKGTREAIMAATG